MKNKTTESEYLILSGDNLIQDDPDKFQIQSALSEPAVFTTFRTHTIPNSSKQAFFLLDAHLDRLSRHSNSLGLKAGLNLQNGQSRLKQVLHERVGKFLSSFQNKEKHARIRIRVNSKNIEVFIDSYLNPWEGLSGVKAAQVGQERQIPELKTAFISESHQARQEAVDRGCHEALMVDKSGVLREGAWSNIFWVAKDGELNTTASGVLAGITRDLVIAKFDTELHDFKASEILENLSEMFLTQSTSGVTAVLEVDGKRISNGEPGPMHNQSPAILYKLYS